MVRERKKTREGRGRRGEKKDTYKIIVDFKDCEFFFASTLL
jgi:hypothetical protein